METKVEEKMQRVQVSMYEKLLSQIDKERGSISRSSYIRAVLESAKLSGNKILKLAKQEEKKANAKRFGRPAKQ
jgi:metal-responsive CopG/Arc/MetJ family transcriptional regulator